MSSGSAPLVRRYAARGLGLVVALLPLVVILSLPARLGVMVFDEQVAALVLAAGLAVVFLRMGGGFGAADRLVGDLLALVAVGFGVGLALRFPVLSEGAFFRPVEAAVFGAVAVALLVEGLRRVAGWTLTVVFALLVAYALLGHMLPAFLAGKSLSPGQLLGFLAADSTALLGQTLTTACFIIVPFILFGRMLVAVGAAQVFDVLGARLAGRAPGASGRVTIISSMLFGTISGSAVANVMANGTVTIGMMQRNGYSREDAAAAEAVSSTGGQIMPPVMGAAAFIMAEYLKVPYATIMTAALLPALLFYGATACQLDFLARKMGLPAYDGSGGPPVSTLALEGLLLLTAFVLLLGGIFWLNLPTELAAVIATGVLALAGLSLLGRRGFSLGRLVAEVAETGLSSAEVLLVCGLAGLIVALLTTTGLGFTLSLVLLEIGRYSLLVLLAVTALVSLILGMGMPTTAVYMLLATLAAPSLVQLGVQPLAAHMFVFYYGLLSMITPPVALAAFAAASIAGASPMKVSWHCMRLGWVAFLVPFLFVYQPAVLMQGSVQAVGLAILGYFAAVPLVTGALLGHALHPLRVKDRLLWGGIGAAILAPFETLGAVGSWVEVATITLGGMMLFLHGRAREKTA